MESMDIAVKNALVVMRSALSKMHEQSNKITIESAKNLEERVLLNADMESFKNQQISINEVNEIIIINIF